MAATAEVIFKIKAQTTDLINSMKASQADSEQVNASLGRMKVALVAAGVAGVAAFAKLTTSAVQSFAEYEQLVGGVDTLFKGSSQEVQKYAEEAYKTAGISANNYMSTITGFSASLIQSLGGDTAKAAKIGNMAVLDMADNANKMGTSMETIQATYSSLARGNFAMLDNLKLGYGGTKKEMERLLADAQKLTGQEYDISNFADVTQAIHAIQVEMGITGTTVKEGSATITGSAMQMKAAFDNMLTAFASGDQGKIDETMNQFIDAFKTFSKNIIPVITKAISGLIANIPSIVGSLAQPLIDALSGVVSGVFDGLAKQSPILVALAGAISGIVAALIAWRTIQTAINVLTAAFNVIMNANPIGIIILAVVGLIAALVTLYNKVEGFRNAVNKAVTVAKTAFTGFWNLIKTIFGKIYNTMITPISNAVSKIKGFLTSIITAANKTITGIGSGIKNAFNTVVRTVKNLINDFMIRPLNSAIGLINKIPGVNIGKIPLLADGGIVNSATLAMIGEGSSPEAVVPLTPKGISSFVGGIGASTQKGGDVYYNFNIKTNKVDESFIKQTMLRYAKESGF